MNASHNTDNQEPQPIQKLSNGTPLDERFKESILLADYIIRSALVELSELGQQSIEDLQSIPGYQQDIIQMLEGMESAKKQLDQAMETSKRLVKLSTEVK